MTIRVVLAGAGLSLFVLTACSSTPAAAPGSPAAAAATQETQGAAVNGCTLVTAADLSQAAGVKYTAIQAGGTGTLCNVTGANPADSFYFHVDKEKATTDWDNQVGIIKEDDGSVTNVPGIGDRAAQGGAKEFVAESHGYLIVVAGADMNNSATAATYDRTKKIEQLLISKLK